MDSSNQTKSLDQVALEFFKRLMQEPGYLNLDFGSNEDECCIDTCIPYLNTEEKEKIKQWVNSIAKKSIRNI